LAAGVALAVMETLADYGAVQFLSVQTLTTGVVRAWSVFRLGPAGAVAFALALLAAAALLLWIERAAGGTAPRQISGPPGARLPVRRSRVGRGLLAWPSAQRFDGPAACLTVAWLAWNAWSYAPELARLAGAARNSLILALAGALLTTILAGALAIGGVRRPLAARLASLGYATPGAAIAIGLLVPVALVWRAAAAAIGSAIALLLYAYAARLMAAALEPIDSGLARVTPSMLHAGRNLGRSEGGVALAVQLPVARGAFLTGRPHRVHRHPEGAAGDPDPAPVRLRHAGGDRQQLCARRAAGPGGLAGSLHHPRSRCRRPSG
jgi:iron(III) transport system permease protein